MYNIILLVLTYSLPSLNNVYSGSLNIPLFGKQTIEFERLKQNTSRVRLYGLINCDGLVYNDENYQHITKDETTMSMSYELDPYLKNIMTKYRCSIKAPYYDKTNDSILFVLKINMLGLTKSIKLLNTNSNTNT
jgi:hypothetical protein